MKVLPCYVDGRFVSSGPTFEKVHPADGKLVARAVEADQTLVDEAVRAGRRALSGPWGSLPVRERAALLHRVADGIERRFAYFLEAEIGDTGKPIALALGWLPHRSCPPSPRRPRQPPI